MKGKLTLSYRGTNYSGWQVQAKNPELQTIQGELEQALFVYFRSEFKKQFSEELTSKVAVMGSGRTDSGVHAHGQIASFVWPEKLPFERDRLLSALNGILPDDISVWDVSLEEDSFDARRTLHIKRYVYRLLLQREKAGAEDGLVWCVRGEALNLQEMILAAHLFRGEHDFSNFRTSDCSAHSTIRRITVSELVRVSSNEVQYHIQGYGFLKQMVRIIVRSLVDVGKGKRSREELQRYLSQPENKVCLPPAPPQGLTMSWVQYEG